MLACAVILASCLPTFAQVRIVGAISGTVTDPSGAAVPGARIVIKDEGTGNMDFVPNHARKAELEYALSNSFGFGGTNGALLFKRWSE